MQTIAQQTMTLDQAESRIRSAIARKDTRALVRVANRLKGMAWAGAADDGMRVRRLWRTALNAKVRIEAEQKPKRPRKKPSDSSSDG